MENYINNNLQYGKDILTFVKTSAVRIKGIMNSVNTGTDETILAELLPYYPLENGKKKKKKKKKSPRPPEPVPPSLPNICNASQIDSGFRISDNNEWEDDEMIGKHYRLDVSYDVDEGTAKIHIAPTISH